ncbi:GATOR2 complex protein WDR24 [Bacillus rossius redtenbacheri]|uniref:GATOR2 complex protein WDR24 n=1 Tax=Bacillus rossius redtenbacheri TaxID=93214 RepID=UPI002FDD6C17
MPASTMFVTQEGPANALALNKDYTQVVIAGRNVFKVFSIEEEFVESCNLRVGKNLNLNFSCNDVAWNTIEDHILATAATNGAVVLWNLNRPSRSKQDHVFIDHKRTVNKVSFHTAEPTLLISGSQDGTMKCFDLRMKEATRTFFSNTESVRDVQFSPHKHHVFAAVSENGNVQLWDMRRPERWNHQFTAHSGPVFACDWHPEAPWLATASRDKTIKVWDLSSKSTLEYTINTIASVGHVKWRPQCKYHIASCALVVDCSINVWDVRRPFIPYAAFNEHRDVATGVAWRGNPNVFLSTSRDCTLYQHVFKDASRPAERANPQGITMNSWGDVTFACRTNFHSSSKALGIHRKPPLLDDQFCFAASVVHRYCCKMPREFRKFYECAQQYVLTGRSLAEICDHNAAVARSTGRNQVSLVWSIVKTLYDGSKGGGDLCQQQTPSRDSDPAPDPGSTATADVDQRSLPGDTSAGEDDAGDDDAPPAGLGPQGDFMFGDGELDPLGAGCDLLGGAWPCYGVANGNPGVPEPDWTLPVEAFPLRHEIQDRSPPPEQFPGQGDPHLDDHADVAVEDQPSSLLRVASAPRLAPWDPSGLVAEALRHHAALGDVQTPACVLLAMGERRRGLAALDEATQEQWLLGYLDVLARLKLWGVATQVIQLAWAASVSQLNQQSTTVHTCCGRCGKAMLRSGWLCDRCHSAEGAACAVCRRVVRGLYAWCQGCSHGGHLAHMREWWAGGNRDCPAGCGHACEYS